MSGEFSARGGANNECLNSGLLIFISHPVFYNKRKCLKLKPAPHCVKIIRTVGAFGGGHGWVSWRRTQAARKSAFSSGCSHASSVSPTTPGAHARSIFPNERTRRCSPFASSRRREKQLRSEIQKFASYPHGMIFCCILRLLVSWVVDERTPKPPASSRR